MRQTITVKNPVFDVLVLAIALVIIPGVVYANAGTPLMMATALHLYFGNMIIGLIEGIIIAYVWGTPKKVTLPVMVLANYVSMIGGFLLSVLLGSLVKPFSLGQVTGYLIIAVLIAFVITILIEWPFVYYCLKSKKFSRWRLLKISAVVQVASYILIFFWYMNAIGISMITQTELDDSLRFVTNKEAVCFFIDDEGDVAQISLSGGDAKKIMKTGSETLLDLLYVEQSHEGARWDLFFKSDKNSVPVVTGVGFRASRFWRDIDNRRDWYSVRLSDLRTEENPEWKLFVGNWAIDGLRMINQSTGEKIHLALETPFLIWNIRNVTVLPGDEVVFQAGEYIYIFNIELGIIGTVTRGRSPIVGLEL